MMHRIHDLAIDRYFGGRLGRQATAKMLARLERCQGCRARYERHLLLERALPDGPSPEERLWSTIVQSADLAPTPAPAPGRPRRPPRSLFLLLAAGGALALVILVPLLPRLGTDRRAGDPVPRGPGAGTEPAGAGPQLFLYRTVDGQRSERLARSLRAHDGMLVAYSNPSADLRFLMVFGVDAAGAVHWYHPAYERAGENPAAVPIRPEALGVELGEEIHHDLPPGELTVFGLFLPRPRTVLEIEELVRRARAAGGGAPGALDRLDIPEGRQVRLSLEVTP
jgi:hypothetical protein